MRMLVTQNENVQNGEKQVVVSAYAMYDYTKNKTDSWY